MNDSELSDLPTIGWFCIYTPEEILTAAGLGSRRLIGSYNPISLADAYLPNNLCPHIRSCLDCGLRGEYSSLGGLIFVNSCDAMRRLYDVWREYIPSDFTYILDLPRVSDDRARRYYLSLLQGLISALEKKFRINITEEGLRSAIGIHNETRSLLRKLYSFKRGRKVSGREVWNIISRSMTEPKLEFNEWLRGYLRELENAEKRDIEDRPKILISGNMLGHPQLWELVEEAGGIVISDDLCIGTRYFYEDVDTSLPPLEALVDYQFRKPQCARMRDTERRFSHLLKLVRDSEADGVIYHVLKFCDTFAYDLPPLKTLLTENNIPLLFLEGDHSLGSAGQLRTRIQAFLEVLQ